MYCHHVTEEESLVCAPHLLITTLPFPPSLPLPLPPPFFFSFLSFTYDSYHWPALSGVTPSDFPLPPSGEGLAAGWNACCCCGIGDGAVDDGVGAGACSPGSGTGAIISLALMTLVRYSAVSSKPSILLRRDWKNSTSRSIL